MTAMTGVRRRVPARARVRVVGIELCTATPSCVEACRMDHRMSGRFPRLDPARARVSERRRRSYGVPLRAPQARSASRGARTASRSWGHPGDNRWRSCDLSSGYRPRVLRGVLSGVLIRKSYGTPWSASTEPVQGDAEGCRSPSGLRVTHRWAGRKARRTARTFSDLRPDGRSLVDRPTDTEAPLRLVFG